jgi:hypothetical protein
MSEKISIGIVAEILGVSIQTLRRWDNSGFLKSHRSGPMSYRYYTEDEVEDFLSNNYKYLADVCRRWAFDEKLHKVPFRFYCPDRSVFKARLSKLEMFLSRDLSVGEKFSIITSIIGEIGNNSFDHNLGNWPDVMGIVFCYNLEKREIILADRGQGILATLRRVKRELSDHEAAVKVAFTEIISGRSPESRGNGLKYVREQVEKYSNIKLYFQSGDAYVDIGGRSNDLKVNKTNNFNRGCFVRINY